MGMDLIPVRASSDDMSLSYNWSGWRFIREFADTHGVPTDELDGLNDGKRISASTCRAMANAIRENAAEYDAAFGSESGGYGLHPAEEHAEKWRKSGGFWQW